MGLFDKVKTVDVTDTGKTAINPQLLSKELAKLEDALLNKGGDYGGGGGGHDRSYGENGDGAQGAVRIVWGYGRIFPSSAAELAGESTN